MPDPQIPKHDPDPIDPDAQGDPNAPPGPDDGKDLNYLVPKVSMLWQNPPSFNLDPPQTPDTDPTGSGPPEIPTGDLTGRFWVNLRQLGDCENTMLSALRTGIAQYESLRALFEASLQNPNMYGPAKSDPPWSIGLGDGQAITGNDDWQEIDQLHDEGVKFAAEMNPAQEKALKALGDAFELAGSFVTMLNHSGQSYAATDRAAKFPDPPAGSPVT